MKKDFLDGQTMAQDTSESLVIHYNLHHPCPNNHDLT